MRQLQVQRKMLNSEDWTAALMVKSRQWRDTGKFKEPHHMFYRLGYSELPAQLPSWDNAFQVGNLSFFNNAAYRGSWRKLFSRGFTFVLIRPLLRSP